MKLEKYFTIGEMKELEKNAGFYFFDKKAVKDFASKVEGTAKYNYFITSENNYNATSREYRIRKFNPDTYLISTVLKPIEKYATLQDAKQEFKKITDEIKAVENAIKKADKGYREQNIIDNYDSYEITNNGLTANIFSKEGNGFQVVIKAFNSQKIGSITN